MGALELVDRDGEVAEPLAKIDRSLTRMSEIIQDVLTLAREGQAVDETEPLDIGTIATEVWAMVETGESNLAVDSSTTIAADPTRARDLFANLFRNAVEHNDDPVTVTVDTLDGGFYVADDGTGVPTDEDIFEMGHSTQASGTGIGLAIVAQIADAHGWDVHLTESEAGGARFELTGTD
jgi:signal transduction histidine kinase